MSTILHTLAIGVTLLLAVPIAVAGPDATAERDAKTAPVQGSPVEEIEPPPAPLLPEPGEAEARPLTGGRPDRPYVVAGYSGVALTLALVTAGTTLGLLAQQRADQLSQHTAQIEGGLPPIYDAAQHARYVELQDQGQRLAPAAVACFVIAGLSATATGLLFWDRQRLFGKALALRVAAR